MWEDVSFVVSCASWRDLRSNCQLRTERNIATQGWSCFSSASEIDMTSLSIRCVVQTCLWCPNVCEKIKHRINIKRLSGNIFWILLSKNLKNDPWIERNFVSIERSCALRSCLQRTEIWQRTISLTQMLDSLSICWCDVRRNEIILWHWQSLSALEMYSLSTTVILTLSSTTSSLTVSATRPIDVLAVPGSPLHEKHHRSISPTSACFLDVDVAFVCVSVSRPSIVQSYSGEDEARTPRLRVRTQCGVSKEAMQRHSPASAEVPTRPRLPRVFGVGESVCGGWLPASTALAKRFDVTCSDTRICDSMPEEFDVHCAARHSFVPLISAFLESNSATIWASNCVICWSRPRS